MHFETFEDVHFDARRSCGSPTVSDGSRRWRAAPKRPRSLPSTDKAKVMRRVISVLFAARDYHGQYIDS